MSIQKLILMVFSVAAISPAFAQTTTTNTATRTITSPPIGLGSTETAEVNVVNTASNSSGGTAASCTGAISFLNASGTAIGSATSFTVTSGEIFSAHLAFSNSGGTAPRTVIRASVQWTLTSGTPCALQVSMDTYETSTGATNAFLPSLDGEAIPGPGPGPGYH